MIEALSHALIDTGRDVLAVSALLIGFQYLVLRQPIPHLRRLVGALVWYNILQRLARYMFHHDECEVVYIFECKDGSSWPASRSF